MEEKDGRWEKMGWKVGEKGCEMREKGLEGGREWGGRNVLEEHFEKLKRKENIVVIML